MYDITNAKSFDNIAKWLRNIDEHANEDVERMILGNKVEHLFITYQFSIIFF